MIFATNRPCSSDAPHLFTLSSVSHNMLPTNRRGCHC